MTKRQRRDSRIKTYVISMGRITEFKMSKYKHILAYFKSLYKDGLVKDSVFHYLTSFKDL